MKIKVSRKELKDYKDTKWQEYEVVFPQDSEAEFVAEIFIEIKEDDNIKGPMIQAS